MESIMDLERLVQMNEEQVWKEAYQEEIQKLSHLSFEINRLTYQLYATGEQPEELQGLLEARKQTMADPAFKAMLRNWSKYIEDPIWKKRLSLMLNEIEKQEIESDSEVLTLKNELEGKLFSKTFEIDETEFNSGQVHSALMDHPDRAIRRKLTEAMNDLGEELTEDFRRLIKARNKKAKEFGYSNYYDYKFKAAGLNFHQYKEEGLRLFRNSAAVINEWMDRIKERFGYESLHVYDFLYTATNYTTVDMSLFPSDKIETAIEESLAYFGMELKNTPINVELLHIPFGGFCIEIAPEDIKLTINKRNSHLAFASAFHELGHALYNCFASSKIPEFKELQSVIGHEAMAELFMTIPYQKEWLVDYFGLNQNEAEQLIESKHLVDLFISLFYFYISLVEYEVYQNPDGDLQDLADSLLKDVLGLDGPGQHPASQAILVSHPAYVQDYIYADGIRDMLRHYCKIDGMYKQGTVFTKILQEFMEPTERFTWQERVKSICGEDFTFNYFEQFLVNKSLIEAKKQ
ncbi:peptidase M3A and M3B thimet/oligopeptidase F [Neobacillus bataviensis LMG 21833]|uniref:Peptidase M3A and M3B thimet/oligopeptidase F n=1 Tax=Neobacillus bataviensis LMG 21833 TaxID=1117379 RepID=K6DRH6_9BACI|nr:M3 family metallopeptidase [Neobacillus bataviensis]EKN70939.1 peptidase M3A and M3B thimet/oligopeptidase F [Neobacillus bataviensis LMG 21833]